MPTLAGRWCTRPRSAWHNAERTALRDHFEASELPFLVGIVEQAGLGEPTALRVAQERIRL